MVTEDDIRKADQQEIENLREENSGLRKENGELKEVHVTQRAVIENLKDRLVDIHERTIINDSGETPKA